MMKNDFFQKALKSIQEDSRSDFGVSGDQFGRFQPRKMTKMRNLRYYKIWPQNAGK